jgi:hypothetical protein
MSDMDIHETDMGTNANNMGTHVSDMGTHVIDVGTLVIDMGIHINDMGTHVIGKGGEGWALLSLGSDLVDPSPNPCGCLLRPLFVAWPPSAISGEAKDADITAVASYLADGDPFNRIAACEAMGELGQALLALNDDARTPAHHT